MRTSGGDVRVRPSSVIRWLSLQAEAFHQSVVFAGVVRNLPSTFTYLLSSWTSNWNYSLEVSVTRRLTLSEMFGEKWRVLSCFARVSRTIVPFHTEISLNPIAEAVHDFQLSTGECEQVSHRRRATVSKHRRSRFGRIDDKFVALRVRLECPQYGSYSLYRKENYR